MAPTQDTSAFDSKYVSTNIRAGAPPYSPELVRKLRNELCELDREEFEYLSYPVLVCSLYSCRDLGVSSCSCWEEMRNANV